MKRLSGSCAAPDTIVELDRFVSITWRDGKHASIASMEESLDPPVEREDFAQLAVLSGELGYAATAEQVARRLAQIGRETARYWSPPIAGRISFSVGSSFR